VTTLAPGGATALRGFFRAYAAGVSVVTLAGPSGPVGFTASSLASVSLDPPLVSFNVSRTSSAWPALQQATYAAVHLVGHDHRELARLFATSGADRFGRTRWRPGPAGVPLLDEPAAWLLCRLAERVPAGDSTLVLAQVEDASPGLVAGPAPAEPLVWADGGFRRAV
jgi:flavin reductase (DIM6/NTAB) family NADH-FMN oxidoreductase RutF